MNIPHQVWFGDYLLPTSIQNEYEGNVPTISQDRLKCQINNLNTHKYLTL